jgi:proteasome accessory factor A
MQEPLFGIETEYAFTHFAPGGKALDRAAGLEQMLASAPRKLKCLHDSGAPGFYLSNGSRLYIDAGHHPELSTPECSDPWEAVRYIQAGERILAMLAGEVERGHRGSRASVYRCNVDYITGQTWGCHESYLHRTTTEALAEEIIPHLVSRLIYTGAGGFDNHSSGLEFTLSPRVPHLGKNVSNQSTHDRGIFHTKDEPLCANGYHRLHILCGESQCSQLGTFLKIGATALVVRMIEAGVCRGHEMALRAPPTAMRGFSTDPSCTRREPLRNGKKLSALEIQRHYLEAAEAHVSRDFMPPWAGEVCARWRQMLDRLEGGEAAVSTVLDWGIKLTLFREHARKRGASWDELARCVPPVEPNPATPRRPERQCVPPDPELLMLMGDGRSAEERARLAHLLESRRPRSEELRIVSPMGAELFALDTRFGELGPSGIFSGLDEAGVLDHRLEGLGDVEEAIHQPPARGRARERGQAVLRHCKEPKRYTAAWQAIVDHQLGRVFDLGDPFGRNPSWTTHANMRGASRREQLRRATQRRETR